MYMSHEQTISHKQPILFFDGVCNLCNGAVQWVIRRDRAGIFRFAALQSETGQTLLQEAGLPAEELSTVILYEDGRFHTHSDVPLRVWRRLGGAWAWLYVFRFVPRFLRDGVYNWIARNRYRWFGRQDQCMIPTPELRERFLD
jgi:predicted DCC family thiol-disulfide oxidoreductase YuxK